MNREAVVTSYSIDTTFESCPRKFEFQHVYGVGAVGESGYAADVGTALHEAIQAWAMVALTEVGDADESREERQARAVDAGLYALMEWWPWVLEAMGIEEKRAAVSQRSLNRALALYHAVISDSWWDAWELVYDDEGTPCIEVPFRIDHTSMPTFTDHRGNERYFATQGKIDFVLRHRQTGEFRVVDLKTTNASVQSLDAKWRFSGQGPGYAVVLSQVLGLPWREKGLTVTYLACVFGNLDDLHVAPEPMTYTLSPADIEDKLREDYDRRSRMLSYGKMGWWPRRAGACESFGRVCPYFSVCHRRDSKFIDKWLAVSKEYQRSSRIYEAIWKLEE